MKLFFLFVLENRGLNQFMEKLFPEKWVQRSCFIPDGDIGNDMSVQDID